MRCSLALVLHAHLPFVYHPEIDDALEESWLFEAMTDTYIPMLMIFEKLQKDAVPFRLTVSLSPTLLAMFENPLLMYRYSRRIARLLVLAEKERERTKGDIRLHRLAHWYQKKITMIRAAFEHSFQKNLTQQFKKLQDDGLIEILGSTATHGYLPLLQFGEGAVDLQIQVGLEYYQNIFQRKPVGLWLPECGYYDGLEKHLADSGIGYTFLETHGLTRAEPPPRYGVYEPIEGPNGVLFFGRDPESSRQVWSADHGYPADPVYRDFYRDIAYDLDGDSLLPFIHSFQPRCDSGFKYYKITGPTDQKEYYDPLVAGRKAKEHAVDFVQKKIKQTELLCHEMDKEPLYVAPFDAELFGHWWGEGIVWLDHVVRQIALVPEKITMVCVSDYLKENQSSFKAQPAPSSWGANGHNKVWLNEKNEWIWRHLHHGIRQIRKFVQNTKSPSETLTRGLKQACRELLLAQSSDWAFMIGCQTSPGYAYDREKKHILNLNRLLLLMHSGEIDVEWLTRLESTNIPFQDIDCHHLLGKL